MGTNTRDVEALEARLVTAAVLRRRLLSWYRANRRDLPWRRTRDPYAIWVSELMLQQTRVETVIPYYERFLARFPDVASLADGQLEDVLTLWTGLGYYSRARNLHRAAQLLVREHAGELPDDAKTLRTLPGVGRYTAGAVASIAFDRPEPIVDGNVMRVLTRLHGIDGDVRTAAVGQRLWREAEALAKGRSPGDVNQALMELGAMLCTPRAPRCPSCPWVSFCRAHREGNAEALPVKSPKAAPRDIVAVAGVVERRGRWLTVQRPAEGLLGGMWELPGGDVLPDEEPASAIARTLRESVGLSVPGAESVGQVKHVFSHLRLRLHVFRCKPADGRVTRRGPTSHRWLSPARIAELPIGGPTRKALALLESAQQ